MQNRDARPKGGNLLGRRQLHHRLGSMEDKMRASFRSLTVGAGVEEGKDGRATVGGGEQQCHVPS